MMRRDRYGYYTGAFFVALGCTGAFTHEAVAQSFPTRAVRYIMPLPAGSETDVFGRTLRTQAIIT